jgi:DNA helicase-2/ATP-dependent DNA helicase PcrA
MTPRAGGGTVGVGRRCELVSPPSNRTDRWNQIDGAVPQVHDLLQDLNPPQRDAVTHGEGPLLVLAGAGSGKTRVITYRIAHLLGSGAAQPHEITAVTFTNKAAREMHDRVERLTRGSMRGGFVGTFHRWSLELLRRHPSEAGLGERFAIADSDDQRSLMNRALKELGTDPRDHAPRAVLAEISRQVNQRRSPKELEADPGRATTAALWRRYGELKRSAGVVDFDDMLLLAFQLLDRHERLRHEVQRRVRWLLVDEFQDTNRLQLDLLARVLADPANITAVGDEDQAIYRWRGAEMANILSFERHFPGARVVALEENYRSSAPILSLAGHLISKNVQRRGKRLYTSQTGGESVRLYIGDDERAEARWVADRVEELNAEFPYQAMSVLVRTNAQTRAFEEEFTRRRLPHRVVGGLRFWQREEVKHALAYLRLVVRPDDTLAFQRVVNVPARGIGAATLDVLTRHAATGGLALSAAARELPEGLTTRARVSLERFFELFGEAQKQRDLLDGGDFVGWLLEASGLLVMYEGEAEERVARRENLQQLASAVAEAEVQGQSLDEFLDVVALLSDADDEGSPDALSVMTLHAAKGLEFDVVFLVGLEDGLLPHANSRDDVDGLEEERRLAYVGMTRARRRLALSAARTRFLFGQRQPTRPSRFLHELPVDEFEDVSEATLGVGTETPRAESAAAKRAARPGANARRRHARSVVQATVTDASGVGWRPGDRVRHQRFGSGVVLSCQGRGDNLKLVVYFDRAGRKTLVPTIAKLEKV